MAASETQDTAYDTRWRVLSKIESNACETNGRYNAFYRKSQCKCRGANKDLQRKDEKIFVYDSFFYENALSNQLIGIML